MNQNTKKLLFILLGCASLTIGYTHAASLTADQSVILASENHSSGPGVAPPYNISLNANNPGIGAFVNNTTSGDDGTPFQIDFTQAIQGYNFFTHQAPGGVNTIASKFSSGLAITATTTDDSFDSFNATAPKIWTTTDPGANLAQSLSGNDETAGIRDLTDVSGTIDISGLASGTVYFFYGDRNGTPTFTASMVDTDGPEADIDVADFHLGDVANLNERYMSSIAFVNDAGYDSIDYSFDPFNGRWDGIVVTGTAVPEASTFALIGLAGLALLRRRR